MLTIGLQLIQQGRQILWLDWWGEFLCCAGFSRADQLIDLGFAGWVEPRWCAALIHRVGEEAGHVLEVALAAYTT